MKLNEQGERMCDNEGCELLATHTMSWNEQMYYCLPHAMKAAGIGAAMGFMVPGSTVRQMTIDEMIPEPAAKTDAEKIKEFEAWLEQSVFSSATMIGDSDFRQERVKGMRVAYKTALYHFRRNFGLEQKPDENGE